MQLELTDPRTALIVRCQAWAYANVLNGKYAKAQALFDERLAAFDHMAEAHPTDSMGYWSGHYFDSFVDACQRRLLDKL